MNVELARRAVACKDWRWRPGMKVSALSDACPPRPMRIADDLRLWRPYSDQTLPDLTDPATLGCLLALVRKAWRQPTLYCHYSHGMWTVEGFDLASPMDLPGADTEAEALVRALEAAP